MSAAVSYQCGSLELISTNGSTGFCPSCMTLESIQPHKISAK